MRTEQVKIYKIDELSDDAQETAHENYLNKGFEYFSIDDLLETMKAFEQVFPVKVTNWSFDSDYTDISFEMTCDDDIENLTGIRLATYLWNNYKTDLYKGKYYSKSKYIDGNYTNKSRRSRIILDNDCVLTGVCYDCGILQPVYDFMNKPCQSTNFQELMQECFSAFETCVKNELSAELSFEYFLDHASINEYEYTSDGNRY